MSGFQMGAALEPDDTSRRTLAIEEYVDTDQFITDAIDWVGSCRSLPASLVDAICAHYSDSSQFDTVIDDALSGECTWA